MLSQSEIVDEFNKFLLNYVRDPELKIFEFAMDRKFATFLARFIHWTPSQIMQYSNIASFYQKIMIRNDFLFGQVRVFDSKDRISVSIHYKNFGEFKRDGYSSEFNDDFEAAYTTVLKAIRNTLNPNIHSFTDFLEYSKKDTEQLIQSRLNKNNIRYITEKAFQSNYENKSHDPKYTRIVSNTFKQAIKDLILDKKSFHLIMQIYSLSLLDSALNNLEDDLIAVRFYDDYTSFINLNNVYSFVFGSCFTNERFELFITDADKPFRIYIPGSGCDRYGDDILFDDLEEAYQYLLKSVLHHLAEPLGVEPYNLTLKDVLLYQIVQY